MYYLKYNGVDLTQLVKVREVNLPSLPSIEHSEIEMWEMDGNLFSSLSYGNREIEISAIIQPLDPNDLDVYVNDVKRAFFVREPKPLFLGDETRYLLAVTDGEVEIVELGKGTCEIHVTLVAYYPYWLDIDVENIHTNGKEANILNLGDVPTYPIMQVGVLGPASFVQLENKRTNERVLIGELPRTQKLGIPANTNVLFDYCQTLSGWVSSSTSLDGGCETGGSLSITSDGGGICLGTIGSGSGTSWKGASYRRNLDTPVENFRVRVNMSHHSAGINGDPTVIEYKYYGDDDLSSSTGGGIWYTYKVTTQSSRLNVRTGPGTNYSCIGTYPNGHEIAEGEVVNGWLKHNLDGKTAYCSMQYIESVAHDDRSTATVCNFVTNKSTALRVNADAWSKALTTIPSGTVIRCYIEEQGENSKYRQLHTPYKGMYGWIKSDDITRASEMKPLAIEYTLEGETADDKQGRLQLYGFSSSGVQLFSLSLIDDSEWYEATYPLINKNGKEFLRDYKFNEPSPKYKEKGGSNDTIKYEATYSGEYGEWNKFYGDFYIERVNGTWYASIQKTNGKFIQTGKVYDPANISEKLAYIVVYIGVINGDKRSAMSINEIQVQTATTIEPKLHSVQWFEQGDVIEVDCGIPSVKLNNRERNDLVDIGSQFFDLEVGGNEIHVTSDGEINFTTMFNKKYL